MDLIRAFFDASPIAVLFVCVAIGFAIGRIKVAGVPIGGIPGTLFAAIVIGQVGVEVDANIKTMAFALFIYSLGYVSGPSFFQSLGRSTLNLVYLSLRSSLLIFLTIWGLAQIFGLDKGTAAGLLAGGITESAAVGTATEALTSLGLPATDVATMQANIGVAYAITYLFGFTLVVFFVSPIAPRMMRVLLVLPLRPDAEMLVGPAGDRRQCRSSPCGTGCSRSCLAPDRLVRGKLPIWQAGPGDFLPHPEPHADPGSSIRDERVKASTMIIRSKHC